uniref:Uncharacterized protein n=1 Tax=Glossina brevipalpis TaxID=37001 RepID=A0A1A9WLV9_9MUSC
MFVKIPFKETKFKKKKKTFGFFNKRNDMAAIIEDEEEGSSNLKLTFRLASFLTFDFISFYLFLIGLHHAVSLGTIDSSMKPSCSTQIDRNYDSEDENTGRRKLRHTSSTELYSRPSQYSKGDIREQYCLTDRQLNTIERSRRDRFFGCLSRRATPQSLLGGCVGRRVPSDENLAAYAPFYKYPRYPNQYPHEINETVNKMDLDSSYFRRQPASILSTSKMVDTSSTENRRSWIETSQQQSLYHNNNNNNNNDNENLTYFNEESSYHCPSNMGAPGPPTPRTKHVSFARSHTLTSFDDFNVGFRSLGRIKTAQSQERLIGGKKPIGHVDSYYDTLPAYVGQLPVLGSGSTIHMITQPPSLLQHGHSHRGHAHHGHLSHMHAYPTSFRTDQNVQTQQPTAALLTPRPLMDDITALNVMQGPLITCNAQNIIPQSPEIIVVEKKFRNAMKTQATQTDIRKHEFEESLALSPRTTHRVKVVSQGAQTNGLQNGKPLTKSLSQIPNMIPKVADNDTQPCSHEIIYRTQSEEPPRSPLEINFSYYQPPPPPEYQNQKKELSSLQKDDSFFYESNSLPRRTCGYRLDTDFHSLPRRDLQNLQDICKHITECAELMGDVSSDYTSDLLPPPQEYCHDDDDSLVNAQTYPKETKDFQRRQSSTISAEIKSDTPFRRDDVRRQSMPIYVKTEKLIDLDYSKKSKKFFRKSFRDDMSDEKEIIIDFKPYSSQNLPNYKTFKQETQRKKLEVESAADTFLKEPTETLSAEDSDQSDDQAYDPVYENVQHYNYKIPAVEEAVCSDQEDKPEEEKVPTAISAPASPLKEEPIGRASTYPSSDSLANDNTRDHSDGHWNESEVTVLTAEQRSEASFNSNLLLTPSTRRKHLLLQHQQRSSVDTDALDLEEQFTDQSPTISQASSTIKTKSPVTAQQDVKDPNLVLQVNVPKIISPSIEVESSSDTKLPTLVSPRQYRKNATASPIQQTEQRRSSEISLSYLNMLGDNHRKQSAGNADVSECSTNTNTDDYGTCTDTSRRTAGMRTTFTTTTTTTSSSSTTQVPGEKELRFQAFILKLTFKLEKLVNALVAKIILDVSTQSSQMDKTHGESSFESASSLYSLKGEALQEDDLSLEPKSKADLSLNLTPYPTDMAKTSPTHSISSTSSGSYNVGERRITELEKSSPASSLQRETLLVQKESVSDDERSELRYSSSGYYESPHDDEFQKKKARRCRREDEERKRQRKSSIKLDIEKENMRALTSPLKKSPDSQKGSHLVESISPIKLKRFRPKIRRQLRRSSKDDTLPRQRKISLSPNQNQPEKLLDVTVTASPMKNSEITSSANGQKEPSSKLTNSLTPTYLKSSSDACQLKAKSIESLNRSVSPGSDSVFYSEVDANNAEANSGHCSHCGKEVEEPSVVCGDSVESLPYIDNEPDIVKPPSDFADSPVISKTTQRLYKKMDKRFRSEERYQGERGRHYKSRKENIRAKSEERNQELSKKSTTNIRLVGSSPCILPETSSENKQQTIYIGHYDCSRYARLTDSDIWAQLDHQSLERQRDRRLSTDSERSFYTKYQVILHRLVQRRCTLEMYHRQKNDMFQLITSNSKQTSLRRKLEELLKLMLLVWARESHVVAVLTKGKCGSDKTVVVKSDSGEFGFRIHGSKPVVVAAIEPETPAESSGLEVGDIIISVNGVQVLDKHHTEVVKIAHDGCEKLELEVARTLGVLMNEQQEAPVQIIYSGYLWRQSGQAKGAPDTKKWVQRWFVLRSDNCLYYYKTEEDSQPVGAMIMSKHIVEACPPKIGKPHAFKVDSGEGIPIYVAADSEDLANRWMGVLKKAAAQENSWLDKSARNLYKTPTNITRPDCFGYLMKLGSKWCGWSKRYCVLKDACLYFFQDANSKSALGMVCLHGYKVASMPTGASGKKNSFEIVPPESKLRHYYFYTESEMEKKRWISALEYSIDRWIKSG